MNPTSEQVLELLLDQAGFLGEDGRRRPGLINDEEAQTQVDTYLRYSGLFREMGRNSLSPDLVYETPRVGNAPGAPCIYLKVLQDPSPQHVADLRTRLWNHGRIPTLWLITPDSVRIYNAFARPQEKDNQDEASHLLEELHCIGDQLRNVDRFHKSQFDSGAFWKVGAGRRIDAGQRVDQALLRDLEDTESLLRKENLPSSIAHALLGRTIFVKYLEDRAILTRRHFQTYGNFSEFRELLADSAAAYSFFEWLQGTFNGDLFPLRQAEAQSVDERHLDILRRFLSGHVMQGYPATQSRLWPYSFKLIPIELISSIYELFAHTGNSSTAETLSVHYTRLGLIELMLSLSMQDLEDTARILDPACGSGAFLAEAFQRLVWARSKRLGRGLIRQELHELLRTQIFGIDIDRDAVYVAAFSLYLALLEMDPDPQPPDALRFPQLLSSGQAGEGIRNLYVQDFLNVEHDFNTTHPFIHKGFDLIVSNPPWTALEESTAPRDPENPETGVKWGLKYTQQHGIPDKKPDQAFMLRARDFAGPKGRIALVVGSRLFHQVSPTGQRWRNTFLGTNVLSHVVDLSDLVNEDLLFGWKSSTRLPASIVIYSPRVPEPDNSVTYITPKWYPGLRSRDEVRLTGSDIQQLPQQLLRDKPFLWKSAFRGTPRDHRLLCKLYELQTLNKILNGIDLVAGVHRGRGLTFGQGEQRDAARFQGIPYLGGRDVPKQRYSVSITNLPLFSWKTVSKRSNQVVLALPAVVLSRALLGYRTCAALVEPAGKLTRLVTSQSYYGISFPEPWQWLSYRVNALMNSDFALYWAFMNSPALGVDRRLIEVDDWMNIPMPGTILDHAQDGWDDALEHESRLRQQSLHVDERDRSQDALNWAVFRLYGLSEQETVLINDTVQHTIEPFLQRSKLRDWNAPSAPQLHAYARRVCTQINGILQHTDHELFATVCVFPPAASLTACGFRLRQRDGGSLVSDITYDGIESLLAEMSGHLREEVAENLYVLRDLRVYDDEGFWIIKPAEGRLWTEAAALNDADIVVQEHMETAG